MNLLLNKIAMYLPIIVASADTKVKTSSFIDNLVGYGAGVAGGIVALFLIISIAKDGFEFAKGQGAVSIWKILGKIIFLILLIGFIFLAVNYSTLGDQAQNIGNKAINTINSEAGNVLP